MDSVAQENGRAQIVRSPSQGCQQPQYLLTTPTLIVSHIYQPYVGVSYHFICEVIYLRLHGRKQCVRVLLLSKAKLIEQHIKLKGQLKELATKMDEIVEK